MSLFSDGFNPAVSDRHPEGEDDQEAMVYEAIKMVKAALGNLPSGIQPDQSKAQSTTWVVTGDGRIDLTPGPPMPVHSDAHPIFTEDERAVVTNDLTEMHQKLEEQRQRKQYQSTNDESRDGQNRSDQGHRDGEPVERGDALSEPSVPSANPTLFEALPSSPNTLQSQNMMLPQEPFSGRSPPQGVHPQGRIPLPGMVSPPASQRSAISRTTPPPPSETNPPPRAMESSPTRVMDPNGNAVELSQPTQPNATEVSASHNRSEPTFDVESKEDVIEKSPRKPQTEKEAGETGKPEPSRPTQESAPGGGNAGSGDSPTALPSPPAGEKRPRRSCWCLATIRRFWTRIKNGGDESMC